MSPKQLITRYPGIISFQDTSLANQLFFGREQDGKKLFYFITCENLTLLYSKSGYGKTSLLQASVFKMLREQNYYPISVRLNKKAFSPQQIIEAEILNINNQTNFEIIAADNSKNLSSFFNGLEIWSPDDKLLTPVIILDQFEEIFTLEHNFKHRADFIDQLSLVLNEAKDGRLKVKFVISIREDFLGHLEKLAIKIPSIFSNRLRLEALTKDAALEAIVHPSQIEIADIQFDSPKIDFLPEASAELVRFLSLKMIDGKWIETNEIEPVQLQIICSELEERAIADKQKNNATVYTINKIALGGDEGMRAILLTFYDKQITKISLEQNLSAVEVVAIRNVIEKELIIGNRRVPIAKDTILQKQDINEKAVNSLIDTKLLKVENYQQTVLVEISHDALVEPISKAFEKRRIAELKERENQELIKAQAILKAKTSELRKKNIALVFLFSCVVLGGVFLVFSFIKVNSNKKELAGITKQIDSFKVVKDSLAQINNSLQNKNLQEKVGYLHSKGLPTTYVASELSESIKADSILKILLKDPANKLDFNITIQYFRKDVDDEKVWVAMKELGYSKFTNVQSQVNNKTNGIFFGYNIKLLDLKVIALTLIRAGFKLQRIADIKKAGTIQLISRPFKSNEQIPVPLTVEEVMKATITTALNKGEKIA